MIKKLEKPIRVTEQEWPESTIPLISISCAAYNHENYIRNAIEGFLIQKTTFPIEILLHDDASLDSTADIIREYEVKYPQLIKAIYQKENQYQKKNGSIGRIQRGRVRGLYYAVCEGDDFWTDPLKLQKQVSFLEQNPEFSLSFHGAKYVYHDKNKGAIDYTLYGKDKVISTNEVIVGGGGLMPTASMVLKAEYIKQLPEWSKKSLVGDYPLAIHLATKGKVFYINDVMSVYNINIKGSWTNSLNIKRIFRNYKSVVNMLFRLTKAFKGKYLLSVIARTLIETKYLVEYVSKTVIKKAIRR